MSKLERLSRIPLHDHVDNNSGGKIDGGQIVAVAEAHSSGPGITAHAQLTGVETDQHHAQSHDHSASGDGTSLSPATLVIPSATSPSQTAEGSAVWDSDDDTLTVGTGAGRKEFGYLGSSAPSGGYGTAASGSSKEVLRKDAVLAKPTEADLSFSDNTTNDASASQHGLLKKLPGGTATFLRADGTFAAVGSDASTIFRGCRLLHSTSQSISNGTYTPLLLDTEDYDTDGFHFTSNANLTGTVSKTAGSTTITGSSTTFTTQLSVNQIISIPGTAEEWFVVTAIASDTSLTVAAAAVNTASGQTGKRISQAVAIPTGLGGYYQIIAGMAAAINTTGIRRVFSKRNAFDNSIGTGSIAPAATFTEISGATSYGLTTANKSLSQYDYVTLMGYQSSGGTNSVGTGAGEPLSTTLQIWRVG